MTDVFREAISDIYEAFKDAGDPEIQEAVFQPVSGDPVPCTVRIYAEDDSQVSGFEGQVSEEITVIEYQVSEIDRDAVRGETFTVDSTTHTVEGIRGRDSVSIRVAVI